MTQQEKFGCLFGSIRILIVQPIWYYLLYKLLEAAHASQLMWFLYLVYLPVSIVLAIVEIAVKEILKK